MTRDWVYCIVLLLFKLRGLVLTKNPQLTNHQILVGDLNKGVNGLGLIRSE